jgi:cytochrome P450
VFGRQLTSPIELAGYRMPAGVEVYASPYAMHRDPRFFADPLRFDPERWLDPSVPEPPRYAYIPFGVGARSCIGSHFAKLEAALVLATLLREVRVQVVPGYRIALQPVITLRPAGGLPAIVRRIAPRSTAVRSEIGSEIKGVVAS